TLVAVLAHTQQDVKANAATQLSTGASVADQLLSFRATQLASAAAVLAADYGFHEAVASGDAETMLSAAQNHSARIGADMMLLTDVSGRVMASSPAGIAGAASLRELIASASTGREQARFALLGGKLYQLVAAPVRAPELIGWAVMGFSVNDALAERVHQ